MGEENRATWDHIARLSSAFRDSSEHLHSLQASIDALRPLVTPIADSEGNGRVMELLSEALVKLRDAIGAEAASLLALDEDTAELVFVIAHGDVPSEALAWRRIPVGTGVAGWVAKTRRPATVNNVSGDERFFPELDAEFDHITRSIVAAPVILGDRLLGVVEILNKHEEQLFHLRDETMVCLFAHIAAELLSDLVHDADPSATLAPAGRP